MGVVAAVFYTLSCNDRSRFRLGQNAEKEPGRRGSRVLPGGARASIPGLARFYDVGDGITAAKRIGDTQGLIRASFPPIPRLFGIAFVASGLFCMERHSPWPSSAPVASPLKQHSR